MEITISNATSVKFEDVVIGDMFIINTNDPTKVFIKTDYKSPFDNAASLDTGEFCSFQFTTRVFRVAITSMTIQIK